MVFRFSHVCGNGMAWKEQLIKKVHDRRNIVEMNDELGDLMYAKDEVELQAKWICFYKKWHHEGAFLHYFYTEWMTRTDKWLCVARAGSRSNQNTNGAIEAWHLTLKKFIARWLGEMQSRRLDALINLLFGHMLSFFMYNMYCKRNGLVKNMKAEEIAISSLHLAQFELKNAKVFAALIPYFSVPILRL
jgi:hypothetical protein